MSTTLKPASAIPCSMTSWRCSRKRRLRGHRRGEPARTARRRSRSRGKHVFAYVHDERARDTERQVACVAEQRHLEQVKALHVGDAVVPLGEAAGVPELPEKPANERRKCGMQQRPPVALRQRSKQRLAEQQLLKP